MEEAVSTFHSVVEAEQRNDGPQQKLPLAENKTPTSKSNQEQRIVKAINRQKGAEGQPTPVDFDVGAESCRKTPIENGVICTGKKV